MKFVLLQLSFLVLIGPVICNNSTGIVPPLSNNTLTTTVKPAGSCKNGSCDNCSKTRGNTFVCLSEKECKKASKCDKCEEVDSTRLYNLLLLSKGSSSKRWNVEPFGSTSAFSCNHKWNDDLPSFTVENINYYLDPDCLDDCFMDCVSAGMDADLYEYLKKNYKIDLVVFKCDYPIWFFPSIAGVSGFLLACLSALIPLCIISRKNKKSKKGTVAKPPVAQTPSKEEAKKGNSVKTSAEKGDKAAKKGLVMPVKEIPADGDDFVKPSSHFHAKDDSSERATVPKSDKSKKASKSDQDRDRD